MPNVKNVIDGHNKKIRDESKKNKEQESVRQPGKDL